MNQQKKAFILRQIQFLSKKETDLYEVIQKVLSQSLPAAEFEKAMADYKNSRSVLKTLSNNGILQLEPQYLEQLCELEVQHQIVPFDLLSEVEKTNSETFQLLRFRLSGGLSYAIILLTVATVVFYTVINKVLPQFADIFTSFGSQLPLITQFALQWQDSFIPPALVTMAMILFLGYVHVSVKKLKSELDANRILRRIPFINQVFLYSQILRWLSYLKILLIMKKPVDEFINQSSVIVKELQRYCPNAIDELTTAHSLSNAVSEIDFQIAQFTNYAEEIVTNSSRKFNAIILAIIFSFVGFILFATYLPIFQLGTTI